MELIENVLAGALRDEIFDRLRESDSGKIDYMDYSVAYKIRERDRDNQPVKAFIEVADNEGYTVEKFTLDFNK